jgi:cyanophycinase
VRSILWLCAFLHLAELAACAPSTFVGHPTGTLIPIGGGAIGPEVDDAIVANSPSTEHAVVIPTAMDDLVAANTTDDIVMHIEELGFETVTVLHTRDPAEADTDVFVAPLRSASLAYITGGRQWRLVDSYLGARTVDELFGVLDRGGVVAGTSAGCSIMGSVLVRGNVDSNEVVFDPNYAEGFGLLQGMGLDNHWQERDRTLDYLEVLERRPESLGAGVDESTALVIQGDVAQVVGEGQVGFFSHAYSTDPANADQPYEPLQAGESYDLFARQRID